MDDRALWMRTVTREAEKWGVSWSYWEFCSEFGAYDATVAATAPDLLDKD
jgi:endoglucanase